jgi:hypothetical protein
MPDRFHLPPFAAYLLFPSLPPGIHSLSRLLRLSEKHYATLDGPGWLSDNIVIFCCLCLVDKHPEWRILAEAQHAPVPSQPQPSLLAAVSK